MKLSGTFLFLFFIIFSSVNAQQRIDESFAFQSDPAKKYSIYVPSNYDSTVPNKLMLGFHPLNVNRWDAKSWCDTLIQFAETNDLLLICPDGGTDGKVDDPIDLDFTTVLLDSMATWYNIDEASIWAMGFSWGGRATYRYGLTNADKFAGFMPIGAAITGTDQVTGIITNAVNKPFYVIHGTNDNPSVRFTPIVAALETSAACVETNLMSGISHTIDFPNRNAIMTTAFQWLEAEICNNVSSTTNSNLEKNPIAFPNPLRQGDRLYLPEWSEATLFDSQGKLRIKSEGNEMNMENMAPGIYILTGTYKGQAVGTKIQIF